MTGGGGEHILFRHPGGVAKNSAGVIAPGIDVRGDGGYIVAPPSLHIGGRPYAISVDHYPEEAALAPLPDWLLNLVADPAPAKTGPRTTRPLRIGRVPTDWRTRLAGTVGEGERNIALARLAGFLLGRRIDPHACLDLVLAFNAARCRPPLPDREVVSTVASIARRELAGRRWQRGSPPVDDLHVLLDDLIARGGNEDCTEDRPAAYSDDALALRFTERHEHEIHFVNLWGRWLIWNGQRWEIDETQHAIELARLIAREASAEIIDTKGPARLAGAVASAKTVAAIERLARADRGHASLTEDWDANPWLLNTPAGTVDLQTGNMRPHARADRITKMTAVAPGGTCPTWLAFLDRVFAGDQALIAFARRMLGYSLTGSIRDHALFFLYGTGGNGKGVFLNTWAAILGDYAKVAAMETFTASRGDRHPTDLAMLRGARAVIAQETEEGQRWAESRIKTLTGGDPISARFMRQDFFTFTPMFKLMIAANYKPSLRSVDEAVKRRFNLVPFTVTIPKSERDPTLPDRLKAEWPGILAWAIEGCLEWQRIGLAPPPAVQSATASYLADEDTIGLFLAERCTDDPNATVEVKDLFAAWTEWSARAGEFTGSIKRFSTALAARGLRRDHDPITRRAVIHGVRLMSPPSPFGGVHDPVF
jgi:putative DNA primase/helicase